MDSLIDCCNYATQPLQPCPDLGAATASALITVREAFEAYVASGGSARYSEPLCELLGQRPIFAITQDDIDVAAELIGAGKTSATRVRQVYAPMSAVLKFGAARGWCRYWRLRRPRIEQSREPIPPAGEIERLVKAAGPAARRIIIFITHTGMSVADTLRLEWSQVDLARQQLRVRSRSGAIRTIDLAPRLVQILERLPERDGKIFRRPDGREYVSSSVKTALRGACKRAGISPITPRMLQKAWHERQRQHHV